MRRTAGRALPSGRIAASEALRLRRADRGRRAPASCCWARASSAAAVAFLTFVLYVFVYTPLKTRTTLNTLVGAIPGALPPLIGWAAAAGRLGPGSLVAVSHRVSLAVPSLPRDCLDLSGRLPARRFSDADRPGRPGKKDGLPGLFLRARAGSGGPLAGDRSDWPARFIRSGRSCSGWFTWPTPRGSGWTRPIAGPAGCSIRRFCTCRRS